MTRDIAQVGAEGHQDTLRRDEYFPTLIYSSMLHDADEMNKEIIAAINIERDKDSNGIQRSNFKSLGGWHSHNNLHKDKKFDRLTRRIGDMTAGMSENLGYDIKKRLEITTMWSITNPPGASNRAHVHPGALWSGVYYAQAPQNAGSIELFDPRIVNLMSFASFVPNRKRKTECWTKVNIKPVAGKLIFFPSWLYHGVNPNMADGTGPEAERIIISFNINQRMKPKKK